MKKENNDILVYFLKMKTNYHHYLHLMYCLHPQQHHVLNQSSKHFDTGMLNDHLKLILNSFIIRYMSLQARTFKEVVQERALRRRFNKKVAVYEVLLNMSAKPTEYGNF